MVYFKLHPYSKRDEFTSVRVWVYNPDFAMHINAGILVFFNDEWLSLQALLAGFKDFAKVEVIEASPSQEPTPQ